MLLQLHGPHLRPLAETSSEPFIGRITERFDLPEAARASEVLLVPSESQDLPAGFRAYFLRQPRPFDTEHRDVYLLSRELSYLAEGDVVRVHPSRRYIATLYRRASSSNSLLVTERCDNYCVMCSQPPRHDDDSWILSEVLQTVRLMSDQTEEVGITGGEPTLLGDRFVDLLRALKHGLPRTAVHVLSNGRRFSDPEFARSVARIGHPNLMFGIPLYSDIPEEHDYIVQARGAFSETARGVLNLKRHRVPVEIRFVVMRQSYERLPEFARFIARNFLFVDHVALMGLELKGFARANLEAVWMDPLDYQEQLLAAVSILDRAGLAVSIYNHQLCVLAESLHPFARKSISDWKNMYVDECGVCSKRSECGGFFSSSNLRQSRGIGPIMAQ